MTCWNIKGFFWVFWVVGVLCLFGSLWVVGLTFIFDNFCILRVIIPVFFFNFNSEIV